MIIHFFFNFFIGCFTKLYLRYLDNEIYSWIAISENIEFLAIEKRRTWMWNSFMVYKYIYIHFCKLCQSLENMLVFSVVLICLYDCCMIVHLFSSKHFVKGIKYRFTAKLMCTCVSHTSDEKVTTMDVRSEKGEGCDVPSNLSVSKHNKQHCIEWWSVTSSTIYF